MKRYIFKLNKKLGQGLSTLTKIEKREVDHLVSPSLTPRFLLVYFGLGTEEDFNTLRSFVQGCGFKEGSFVLDIFAGYPHGFLGFGDVEESKVFVKYISEIREAQLKKLVSGKEDNDSGDEKKPEASSKTDKDSPSDISDVISSKIEKVEKGISSRIEKSIQSNESSKFPSKVSLKEYMNYSVSLNFGGKERNCFFFPTEMNQSDFICNSSQSNSLPSATRDYSKFEKLGLFVVPEVVTETHQNEIIGLLTQREWENLSHRRVQHFGYRFIYGANSVNKSEEVTEIPAPLKSAISHPKLAQFASSPEFFDQVTVNDYRPGAGIPPHIDSHAPFEEVLISVSLLSDVVMTFKNPETAEEFHLSLPARSALVLTGEARYLWTHQISERKVDRIEGELSFRRRRVSLTYRRTKAEPFCACRFVSQCDFVKNKKEAPVETLGELGTPAFERRFVKEVYDSIGEHFSHTRYKPWPRVAEYLNSLPAGSWLADIGCGNGKYLGVNPKLLWFASDFGETFAKIVAEKFGAGQILVCDGSTLPYKSRVFDHAISIAVIHHLSSIERRAKAIGEIGRVLVKGGTALIYVWAMEQGRKFEGQDVFIDWNNPKKFDGQNEGRDTERVENSEKHTVVYKRYYHVFAKGELEDLVALSAKVSGVELEVENSYYDHENWCVVVKRISE